MINAKDKRMEDLTIDDFPDAMREIASIIGFEHTVMLMTMYGGSKLYIQKPTLIETKWRNQEIRERFNGHNRRELALRYNLSELTISNIIKGGE